MVLFVWEVYVLLIICFTSICFGRVRWLFRDNLNIIISFICLFICQHNNFEVECDITFYNPVVIFDINYISYEHNQIILYGLNFLPIGIYLSISI